MLLSDLGTWLTKAAADQLALDSKSPPPQSKLRSKNAYLDWEKLQCPDLMTSWLCTVNPQHLQQFNRSTTILRSKNAYLDWQKLQLPTTSWLWTVNMCCLLTLVQSPPTGRAQKLLHLPRIEQISKAVWKVSSFRDLSFASPVSTIETVQTVSVVAWMCINSDNGLQLKQ